MFVKYLNYFLLIICFSHTSNIAQAMWDEPWDGQIPSTVVISQQYSSDSLRLEFQPAKESKTDAVLTLYYVNAKTGTADIIMDQQFKKENGLSLKGTVNHCTAFDLASDGKKIYVNNLCTQLPFDIVTPMNVVGLYTLSTGDFRCKSNSINGRNPNISINGSAKLLSNGEVAFHDYNGIKNVEKSIIKVLGNVDIDTQNHDLFLYGCNLSSQGIFTINVHDAIFDAALRLPSTLCQTSITTSGDVMVNITGNMRARLAQFNSPNVYVTGTKTSDVVLRGCNFSGNLNAKNLRSIFHGDVSDVNAILLNLPIIESSF